MYFISNWIEEIWRVAKINNPTDWPPFFTNDDQIKKLNLNITILSFMKFYLGDHFCFQCCNFSVWIKLRVYCCKFQEVRYTKTVVFYEFEQWGESPNKWKQKFQVLFDRITKFQCLSCIISLFLVVHNMINMEIFQNNYFPVTWYKID